MQIKPLKIEIPNIYLTKELREDTLQNLIQSGSHTTVIDRFYRLVNDVKYEYIWAELDDNYPNFSLKATLVPHYVLSGKAREQAVSLGFDFGLTSSPKYVINFKLINLYTNEQYFNSTFEELRVEDVANRIVECIQQLEKFELEIES